MNILIGCEFSGIVRDAFTARGHHAVSCDLLPSESEGHHIQGDILDAIRQEQWDMLIAFPPCTDLSVSGAKWFAEKRADGRQQRALEFVRALLDAPIDRIALENPVGVISTYIRKPDQIVQPWMFGDNASKKTCLWLKGLPPLLATTIISKHRYANQTPSGQNKLGPSPDRWKERSRTYEGIATAMAQQWGPVAAHLREVTQ
jgi:site-specific DNA-cytosine methylase